MAVTNMIVTLAMNASKYAAGLRTAAGKTTTFGSVATKAFNLARTAMLGMTVAFVRAIPMLANMGAESRRADIQLRFMLENMQGVGKATDATVKRMDEYATIVSLATAVDDEQVKAVQKKLLMFKSVRKSADEMGGSFDRATSAAIDLAAGGFGQMETNAIKLGRMLEEPGRSLDALSKAGVIFTEVEKRKITELAESGDLLAAQEVILGKIEGRVKGLAEESATPFEQMMVVVNEIGDTIGLALLEPLGKMNDEIKVWLSTPQAKKDVQEIADAFVAAAEGIRDMSRFLREVKGFLDSITQFNMGWVDELRNLQNDILGRGGGGPGVPETPKLRRGNNSGPTINFNSPIDSVSAGREVERVLNAYNRSNGGRR